MSPPVRQSSRKESLARDYFETGETSPVTPNGDKTREMDSAFLSTPVSGRIESEVLRRIGAEVGAFLGDARAKDRNNFDVLPQPRSPVKIYFKTPNYAKSSDLSGPVSLFSPSIVTQVEGPASFEREVLGETKVVEQDHAPLSPSISPRSLMPSPENMLSKSGSIQRPYSAPPAPPVHQEPLVFSQKKLQEPEQNPFIPHQEVYLSKSSPSQLSRPHSSMGRVKKVFRAIIKGSRKAPSWLFRVQHNHPPEYELDYYTRYTSKTPLPVPTPRAPRTRQPIPQYLRVSPPHPGELIYTSLDRDAHAVIRRSVSKLFNKPEKLSRTETEYQSLMDKVRKLERQLAAVEWVKEGTRREEDQLSTEKERHMQKSSYRREIEVDRASIQRGMALAAYM